MSTTIKIRRDTAARWATNNSTPAVGELCIVLDSSPIRMKIGDGITAFNSLPYFTLPEATTSAAGLMSAADKTKLNGIATAAINEAMALDVAARAVGMAVLVEFDIPSGGGYTLCYAPDLKLMSINGHGYKGGVCDLEAGTYVGAFVFENPAIIPDGAFKGVGEAKVLRIPSWVHEIGGEAFAGTALTDIYCEAMTPPNLQGDTFDDPTALTAYVHKVVQADYQSAATWQKFASINTF